MVHYVEGSDVRMVNDCRHAGLEEKPVTVLVNPLEEELERTIHEPGDFNPDEPTMILELG